jgi:hypothetical protein
MKYGITLPHGGKALGSCGLQIWMLRTAKQLPVRFAANFGYFDREPTSLTESANTDLMKTLDLGRKPSWNGVGCGSRGTAFQRDPIAPCPIVSAVSDACSYSKTSSRRQRRTPKFSDERLFQLATHVAQHLVSVVARHRRPVRSRFNKRGEDV